jgi:hypothetical protein
LVDGIVVPVGAGVTGNKISWWLFKIRNHYRYVFPTVIC